MPLIIVFIHYVRRVYYQFMGSRDYVLHNCAKSVNELIAGRSLIRKDRFITSFNQCINYWLGAQIRHNVVGMFHLDVGPDTEHCFMKFLNSFFHALLEYNPTMTAYFCPISVCVVVEVRNSWFVLYIEDWNDFWSTKFSRYLTYVFFMEVYTNFSIIFLLWCRYCIFLICYQVIEIVFKSSTWWFFEGLVRHLGESF